MKEAIITSSVLIICITLLRQFSKGRISARMQYLLWLVVAVRLVMPAITVFFPDILPESDFSIMNMTNRMEMAAQDYIQPEDSVQSMGVQESFSINSIDELSFLPEVEEDGPTAVLQIRPVVWVWTDWIRGIWYLGIVVLVIWMAAVNLHFRNRLRKSRTKYEVKDFKLPVYIAKNLSSPCLYGLPFCQAVYIPEDMAKEEEKIRHILTHEYCHYRHKDVFWSILRCALVAVYWFHPLVWLAAFLSKQDCELACDEAVIKMLGEEERIAYGKTLVSLVTRKTKASDIACAATTMTGGANSMKERISRIAKKPQRFAAVLILAAAVVGIVSVSAFTQSKEYPEDTYLLEGESSQTVTTSCFQVTFPDSFARRAYYRGANGTDIIVYHKASDREIGRFCMMPYEEAREIADKQEVVPMERYGSGANLSSYINSAEERAKLGAEQLYKEEEESDGRIGVPGVDSNSDMPGTDSSSGVSGTDSNNGDSDAIATHEFYGYTYTEEPVLTESSGGVGPIPAPEKVEKEVINLPYNSQKDDGIGAPRPVGEDETDYLPNEQIATEDYIEVNIENEDVTEHYYQSDEIGENPGEETESQIYLPAEKVTQTAIPIDLPCYLYIPAEYTDAEADVQAELEEMNRILIELTNSVTVFSQHKESMEQILDVLVENRTPYIGDSVKASKIAGALPIASGLSYQYLQLETTTQPYAVTLNYRLQVDNLAQVSADTQFLEAVLMFASIENLETCTIRMNSIDEENIITGLTQTDYTEISYDRGHMEEMFGPLYPYSETKGGMIELYNKVLEYLQEKNEVQE